MITSIILILNSPNVYYPNHIFSIHNHPISIVPSLSVPASSISLPIVMTMYIN